MRNPELLFVGAVMLLIASVALILCGAVLQYQYGPGLGALLFQTGRILLVAGGAVTIWHFKWSRGSKPTKTVSKAKRSRTFTVGMYAFWLLVVLALIVVIILQRQGRYFSADDRLGNIVLSVFPLLLAALVVGYFLVRYSAGKPLSKKSRPPK
jgi:hypothetical protein